MNSDRLADVLLVALEDDAEVDGQVADPQPRLGGAEVHVQLALVVAGAARVHDVVLVPRLERRPDPLVERIGRLDVVVAVDQDGGLVRAGMEPVGGDHRVAAGRSRALSKPISVKWSAIHCAVRRISSFFVGSALTDSIRRNSSRPLGALGVLAQVGRAVSSVSVIVMRAHDTGHARPPDRRTEPLA